MRYQWNGENLTTDVVSSLAAALTGYATAVAAFSGRAKEATIANGILGVGGAIAKYYVASPLAHEALEGIGYGGFYGLGLWAAAALRNKDTMPMWLPKPATTTTKVQMISAPVTAPAAVFASNVPVANWETEY